MAEGGGEAKVRVVRCPNCQKLLPELADISIYRCGGCGTTLLAKRSAPKPESSPEKPDGVKAMCSEISESSSEMKGQVLDGNLETDRGGYQDDNSRKEDNYLSASESMDKITSKKDDSLRVDAPVESNETEFSGRDCQQESILPAENLSESGKALVETNLRGSGGTEKSNDKSFHAQRAVGEDNVTGENPSVFIEGTQQPYPNGDPSNKRHSSKRVYADGDRDMRQNLEQDRAELLRILDELRDQLQRKHEVSDKHKLSFMADRMAAFCNSHTHNVRANSFPDGSSSLHHNSSFPDGSSSLNYNSPLPNSREQKHNDNKLDFCLNMPLQAGTSGYGDPLTHGRVQFNRSGDRPPRQTDNYLNGQPDPDPVNSYSQEGFYHQPACSCVCCYRRWLSVAARCPSTNLGKVPYFSNKHELHQFSTPSILSSRSYNSRFRHNPFYSHEPRKYQSQRATFSKNDGRFCLPFAGATPFMICYNCLELLEVPDRFLLMNKKTFKLRCGACSKVISVQRDGSRIVTSAAAPASPVSSKKNDVAGNSPGDSAQSLEEKLVFPCIVTNSDHEMIERAHGLKNQNEFEKVKGLPLSEHVDSSDSIISRKVVPTSTDIPLGPEIKRVPSLPIPERLDCLVSDQAVDGIGVRSWSKRSEQEKHTFLNGNFKQNSLKDASVATEMDLVNDLPNANSFEDYSDMINKPDVESRLVKVGDSFLAGLKKSFRFHKSTYGRSKVSVNGHPISERLVKKAEKQAGKIHPGDYWYDYRAGFWGVMGHPCHGIIPAFIEEFNYPMPKNCAGGNTGVFVNGRELHRKDLDLLVGRGLPTLAGSYRLEISGRLWEDSSGEELDGLGKLAPTVEKMKLGFGMRVPRVFAK